MTTNSPYPVVLASPHRDSALPVTTTARGTVAWSKEIGRTSTADWPPVILIWGDREVVATYAELAAFGRDGTRHWSRAKQGGTPAAVGDGRLYFKGKHRFLEALNLEDKIDLAEAPFPGAMEKETTVALFWPREHDFVAVLHSPADLEVADGDPPDKPGRPARTTVLMNRYETTYGDFVLPLAGDPTLPPLLVSERQVVAAWVGREVVRVDVGARKELSRFEPAVSQPVDWSVDASETYCILAYDAGRKMVLVLSADGQEQWRWADAQSDDRWSTRQPPVRGAAGRVVVLTEGRVLALEHGRLLWEFDARSDALRHGAHIDSGAFELKDGRLLAKGSLRHAAVLADGSVLVTGNKTLYHLASDGRKLFSVQVDQDILSPPVVDAAGHIYIATATHLVRID